MPNKRHRRVCGDVACRTTVFRVTVSASGDDLQPVQTAINVAGYEATVQQGGKATGSTVDFEAGGLGAGLHVPQPDRVVL